MAAPLRPLALPFRIALAMLACACALATLAVSRARADGETSEPRLMLPGYRAVQAGGLVELRWTPADEIRELEILISLDGGRTYPVCISPQLDPRTCSFLWRVPRLGPSTVHMRIRFNRDGREIEGAPTGPLLVGPGAGREAEPLGLPPSSPGEREPGSSGGRSESPGGRAATGAVSPADDEPLPLRRTTEIRALGSSATRVPSPNATSETFAPPRTPPLRA